MSGARDGRCEPGEEALSEDESRRAKSELSDLTPNLTGGSRKNSSQRGLKIKKKI